MYLTRLKTLLTMAVRQTFDSDYVNPQFRNLHASIEYPDDRQHYPGIWVDFENVGELERVGVAHHEYEGTEQGGRRFTRWRFQGYSTFTIAALTSLERDDLYDELVRVFAFGGETESTSEFRAYIENNDLLDLQIDFDQIAIRGGAVTPGTPWGSDEMIYEITLALEVVGEFVSDSVSQTLLALNEIVLYPRTPLEPDPDWT